jgi:hypothetical protein
VLGVFTIEPFKKRYMLINFTTRGAECQQQDEESGKARGGNKGLRREARGERG